MSGYFRKLRERFRKTRVGRLISTFEIVGLYEDQDYQTELSEEIGSLIRRYRLDNNLTQMQLARRMHVDKATVSRHERGVNLSIDILVAYARALNIDVRYLFPRGDSANVFEERRQDKIDRTIRKLHKLSYMSETKFEQTLTLVDGIIDMSIENASLTDEEHGGGRYHK